MPPENQEFFDMAYEIDASGGYLNSKEQDFMEDVLKMADTNTALTEAQGEWVKGIWDRLVGG